MNNKSKKFAKMVEGMPMEALLCAMFEAGLQAQEKDPDAEIKSIINGSITAVIATLINETKDTPLVARREEILLNIVAGLSAALLHGHELDHSKFLQGKLNAAINAGLKQHRDAGKPSLFSHFSKTK